MRLAFRNLLKDKTRLTLSILGVALATLLILLLNGFLTGMNRQVTSYLDNTPGTILVAQEGVANLLGATSILPPGSLQQVKDLTEVEEAIPILTQFVILDLHEKKLPAYLVGYNPALGGGPWKMSEGRIPESDNELVFDQVLANRHNISLGDTVQIIGTDFQVVGLSDQTTSWMTSFVFVRKNALEGLIRAPGATAFLLIEPRAGRTAEQAIAVIDQISGIQALPKKTVNANDLKMFAKVFSAPLKLMVAIAFLVGTLVVGLVIYTSTIERQREYGVLKAIGARNSLLYRVVMFQALVAALTGSLLGVGLAYLAADLIESIRPQFSILYDPTMLLLAVTAGFGMALLAAYSPARLIAGLAPAEVFRR